MANEQSMVAPAMQIAEYNATAAGLADLRGRLANVVYDVTTTAGMDMARKDRAEVRGLRVALEKKRVEIKAPALERSRLIDAEAKLLTAQLEALETPIDEAIKSEERRKEEAKAERERIERNRVIELRGRIDSMARIPLLLTGASSAKLIQAQKDLISKCPVPADFQEFQGEALNVWTVVNRQLDDAITAKQAEEVEQAKLKAEREEFERQKTAAAEEERLRIARAAQEQAEEQARVEAERARVKARQEEEAETARKAREEADHLAAEARAKADAAAKAARDAEDARVREQQRVEAERIERERAALETRQREEREVEQRRLDAQRAEQEAREAKQRQEAAAQEAEGERLHAEATRLAMIAERNRLVESARRSSVKQALVDIMGICADGSVDDATARAEIGLIAEGTLRPAAKQQSRQAA